MTTLVAVAVCLLVDHRPWSVLLAPIALASLLAVYGLARLAVRLPFSRPTPRGPAVGVAVAIACVLVFASCGSGLWGSDRELLAFGMLSVGVALYTEQHGRTWRATLGLCAPSALVVVVIGGFVALRTVTANTWMWDPSSTIGAPWAGVRFLVDRLTRTVAVPLGWSYAVCHVAAARWPAFAAPGRSGNVLRALPGAVLVLTPVVVFALTDVRPQAPGELVPVTRTPPLLYHAAYLVAVLGMLLARGTAAGDARVPAATGGCGARIRES